MNFFEAQKLARHRTGLFLLLFVLAVMGLLVLSNFFLYEFIHIVDRGGMATSWYDFNRVYDLNLSIIVSAAVLFFIIMGSVYKLFELSSGGIAIAESLGGVLVPRSSQDLLHRRILNVVEEMAIASGSPVPQVYLLNEAGINAFAAGWKTTNVVIGITQGALESLTREELQGVIAHEFSHIFNGDMRLNIRLIAVLYGILLIGMLGGFMARSIRLTGRSRDRSSGQSAVAIGVIGLVVMVIGYTGTFFGNWIKSLISREREYLADASAVQFTRNNTGLANALKKIGGAVNGSSLSTAMVSEYSHAYFARGENNLSFFNFSTHPPLKQRIKRIQPNWDERYISPKRKPVVKSDSESQKSETQKQTLAVDIGAAVATSITVEQAIESIDSIGDITQSKVDAAQQKLSDIPEELREQAENPYGAQLLILVILLDKNTQLRQQQLSTLENKFSAEHKKNAEKLYTVVGKLKGEQILPLIDLVLPTLREMTLAQYQVFKQLVNAFILLDKKVNLREWVIQRVVLQHLDDTYQLRRTPIAKYFVLGSAKQSIEIVLSLLSYVEHKDNTSDAVNAFNSAKKAIAAGALKIHDKNEISLQQLDAAMDDLVLLKYPLKKRVLQACASCISHNGKVTVKGYELMRAVASCLDCPMPAL